MPSGPKFATSDDIGSDFKMYLASGIAFSVGMAWNAAFQHIFKEIPGLERMGPLIYAIILTVIAFFLLKAMRGGTKGKQKDSA